MVSPSTLAEELASTYTSTTSNRPSPSVAWSIHQLDRRPVDPQAKQREIIAAAVVIPSGLNYQRFCSNFFAFTGDDEGGPLLLTNEEATDFVNRTGTAWPGTPGEQAGLVVAYDPETDESRAIYRMGRHNHENSVAIPAYEQAVILSGDDTSLHRLHRCTCTSPPIATRCGTTKARFTVSCPTTRPSTTTATSPSVTRSATVPRGPRRDRHRRPDRSRNVVERQQRLPVHSDRGHRLRPPAIKHRVFRRYRRAASNSRSGDWAPRPRPSGTTALPPTDASSRWSSTRTTRSVVDSLSILIDADTAGYNVIDTIHQPDNIETTSSGC